MLMMPAARAVLWFCVVAGFVAPMCSAEEESRYAPDPEVVRHFLRLHEPSSDDWTAARAELEVTDGCPLNGVYGRFKAFINEGMTAFSGLSVKYSPGMDPVITFYENDGDKEVARVDVSEMSISDVEKLLEKRGIQKSIDQAKEL